LTDRGPLVVAELSGNHNGSLAVALETVEAAAAAGAHAIKLQTYTADTMTLDHGGEGFVIADPGSLWHGERLYNLYQRAHTPWEWHRPLFERARALNMLAFSSAFDASSVDFLEQLAVPFHKIASFENTDLPLIRKAAATGKPLIISTGMASLEEIAEAVDTARAAGCGELTLLQCTSTYPARPDDSNLAAIPELRSRFDCAVGLSDHTLGIGAAIASVVLGVTMIEKHLCLKRSDGGVDSAFSLEPEEFAQLVRETRAAKVALGSATFGPGAAERNSLIFRRSLYITQDLPAGSVLTSENVRSIRPGLGLPPKFIDVVLGRRVVRAVQRGTPLSWELIQDQTS
jgi:pseudaminic acid synthase